MYKMILIATLSSVSLHGALAPRIVALCHPALEAMSSFQGITTQKRTLARDRKLLAGFKSLLKDDHCASTIFNLAIEKGNLSLVKGMLQSGVLPNISHIKRAACTGNCQLAALLLAEDKKPQFPSPSHTLSFDIIKLFLNRGADVTQISGRYERTRYWEPVSPVGDLTADLRFYAQFKPSCSNETYFFELDDSKKSDLLKKVIILTRAGDPLTFIVKNPMSYEESIQKYSAWSNDIYCKYAKGDWTFGIFAELAEYIRAVIVCRKDTSTAAEKDEAQKTMAKIMVQYGITEEEVTDSTVKLPASFRIQEA